MAVEKKKKIQFLWTPLLLVVYAFGLGAIVCFAPFKVPPEGSAGFVVGLNGSEALYAHVTSLARVFELEGSTAFVFYTLTMTFASAIGAYGILAAFLPVLRRIKVVGISLTALFAAMAACGIVSSTLIIPYIENTTVVYNKAHFIDWDSTSGYTHASIVFYLYFAWPVAALLWWIWVLAIYRNKLKKEGP